jgi:VWFA-related protein
MRLSASVRAIAKAAPVAVLAVFFLLVALSTAPAQQSAQKPSANEEPVETLKVDVNVVNLYFNVKDKHGKLIPDLTKSDFQLFEDGKPQTIKYFKAETNQPLTLGMLIDSSASQQHVLGIEQQVGSQFLRQVLGKDDLAFVISFDVNVDLLQDLTASTHDLSGALDRAKVNSGGGGGGVPGMGGGPVPVSNPRGTLLYDAVYLAANDKLASEAGRKAMIVLTDGQDQGSRERINDAIEAAHKADAMCYVLLTADRGFYWFGMGYSGDREMRKLAEETGGRVIDVGNSEKKLKEGFDQIAAELRSQYSVGYTPTNNKHDGTFRKVQIRAKADYKIQARAGYYAPGK